MKTAVIGLAGLAGAFGAALMMRLLVRAWSLERENFQGRRIPTGFGFMLVMAAAPVYAWIPLRESDLDIRTITFLAAIVVFGVTGLLDDAYGTREVGGFKGHFRLLVHGRVTTGAVKALTGGLSSIWLGLIVADYALLPGIVNGLVIALTANTLNLLDLRPGRAISCFWLGIALLTAGRLGMVSVWPELTVLIPAALMLTWLDSTARVMLGDAGSNALGAALGLVIAWELGLATKIAVIVLFAGLNVYSEKHSISALIERNRILRGIDCRLGVR